MSQHEMNGLRPSEQYTILGLTESRLQQKSDHITSLFESASSEQDLNKLLETIEKLDNDLTKDLNHYVKYNHRKFQNDLSNIELQRAKLSETLTVSGDLIKLFSDSNDLGNSLTYQLKALDKEISMVNDVRDHVSLTKLLKNNINQAVFALEHSNYDLAANCVNTIRTQVPESLITGQYASNIIPSTDIPELPSVTINKLTSQLIEVFKVKFNEAATNKDIPQLTKFFQLFPLIGEEEAGLMCYSKFICQIITDTSRNLIQFTTGSSDKNKRAGMYSRSSMQLFENISMMLSQHSPLIKKYYSSTYPNAIPFVITKIQHEIDSQIGLITDTFYDESRITKVLQDIRLYKFPILKARLEVERPDEGIRHSFEDNELVTIVESGDLFNEFASIMNYWALYCKFITTRYFNKTTGSTAQTPGLIKIPQLLVDSNYTKKINSKYLPAFETILNFYLRRSLEKAITIEELPSLDSLLVSTNIDTIPEQPPCSSVIEDFTLILNTCIRGVLDSCQLDAVKSFVNESIQVIQNDLINGYFIKELNENSPRYNSHLSLLNPKLDLAKVSSPRGSRSATPQPESGSLSFFKGAQSALGNVVGTSVASATLPVTNSPKLVNFIVYLNTIAVGQEYLVRILDNFTKNDSHYIRNCFPFAEDTNIVNNILKTELLEPFVSVTNKLMQESLINFYNQCIKAKLLAITSEFLEDSDESNYIIYSPSSLNDNSLIIAFTSEWRLLLRPYKQVLHHDLIFSKLIRLITLNLANIIEKRLIHVLKKFRINELGALKLEKDVSAFISEVCEDNYELRERFVRVTQLVLLVGMDDDEYEESINDTDEFGGINWILTPGERVQFRSFRI